MPTDVAEKLKERKAARMERLKTVKDATAVKRVRVVPTKEEFRKVLRHPVGNQPFPKEGSVEWPLDQFTKRRIREGAVTIEEGESAGGTGGEGTGGVQTTGQGPASGGAAATGEPAQKTGAQEPVTSQEPTSDQSGQSPSPTY